MRYFEEIEQIAIYMLAFNVVSVIYTGLYVKMKSMSKSFTEYHILLLELISFKKLQPPKPGQRQKVNDVMRI